MRDLLIWGFFSVALTIAQCTKPTEPEVGGITGQVTDSVTGKGIEGVSVSTKPPTKTVTTDANGKYEIREVRAGQYIVYCHKEGYKDESREVYVRKNQIAQVDFQLKPLTGVVYGQIIDLEGNPIKGASISTVPPTSNVISDDQGGYQLTLEAGITYTIVIEKKGFKSKSVSVSLEMGERKRVDIQLSPVEYGEIIGKVIDSLTGKGVEDVTITTDPPTVSVKTDFQGEFRITGVEVGRDYTVYYEKSGYQKGQMQVHVSAKEGNRADYKLKPLRGIICGKVEDLEGNPIEGATISVTPYGASAKSDAQGRYQIEVQLVEVSTYTVKAKKQGYKERSFDVILEPGKKKELDFKLLQLGEIIGKVVDSFSKEGIEGVIITTDPPTASVTTDFQGEFRIVDVEVGGDYTLHFKKEGYQEAQKQITVETKECMVGQIELVPLNGFVKLSFQLPNPRINKVITEAKHPSLRDVTKELSIRGTQVEGKMEVPPGSGWTIVVKAYIDDLVCYEGDYSQVEVIPGQTISVPITLTRLDSDGDGFYNDEDLFPYKDAKIQIRLKRFTVFVDDGALEGPESEIYFKIKVDGTEVIAPGEGYIWKCNKWEYLTINWSCKVNVDDDITPYEIYIEMWDFDTLSDDDLYDIDSDAIEGDALYLIYDLKTGTWIGDDTDGITSGSGGYLEYEISTVFE